MTFELKKRRIKEKNAAATKRTFVCPLVPGGNFKLELSYLSPEIMLSIQQQATKRRWDKAAQQQTSIVDRPTSARLLAEACMHGWSGLTVADCARMVALEGVKPEEAKLEVEFTKENATELIAGCLSFDTWLGSVVTSAAEFSDVPGAVETPAEDASGNGI